MEEVFSPGAITYISSILACPPAPVLEVVQPGVGVRDEVEEQQPQHAGSDGGGDQCRY